MTDDKPRSDDRLNTSKLTDALAVPHGVAQNLPGVIDTQADLSSNHIALGLLYNRHVYNIFKEFNPDNESVEEMGINQIKEFADTMSMLTWGAHRFNKREWVEALTHLGQEKHPLPMENLALIPVKTPEGQPEKKGRFSRLGL